MSSSRLTVPARLAQLAAQRHDAPALVFHMEDGGRATCSWRELHDRSEAVGALLERTWETTTGRPPATGDVLAIALGNRIEHLLAAQAAWRLGLTPVAINVGAPEPERDAFLALADPCVVIAEQPVPERTTVTRAEVAAAAASPAPGGLRAYPGSDPAWGIGSGGSTGKPKLILGGGPLELDVAGLTALYATLGCGPEDRTFIAGPLFHASGFVDSMTALFFGQTVVMMERFEAAAALRLMEEERIESAMVVPTMLKRMLEVPELRSRDLSALRALCHLGARCPPVVKRAWIDLIGPERVYEIYGSTENPGMTAIRGDEWLQRPGSVGRPVHGRLLIVGSDGEQLPPGEVGEIYMGPVDELGFDYRGGDPPRIREDGYASVGDLGWVDDDGYLFVADRRSDLIVSGGSNVYPAEVESVLAAHPDVGDAVVVGLPDEEWGQTVHAIVVPSAGAAPSSEELRSFCRARLTAYKVPKQFELVDALPRNEVGKVRRRALVEERTASVGA